MIGVAGPLWHHAHAVRAEQIGAAHRTRLSRWTHERMPQLSSALSAPAMDERAHPVASAGKQRPLLPLWKAHRSASSTPAFAATTP
jgi:hypothetical protein